MNRPSSLYPKVISFRKALLALCIISLCCKVPAAQNFDDIQIGWPDQRHIFYGLLAEKIFGDISSATIAGATLFDENDIEWIVTYLKNRSDGTDSRIDLLESGPGIETVNTFFIVDDMYGFQETFAEDRTEWEIVFPPGKRLRKNGTFLCFIGGLSFSGTARVRKGFGYQDAGIQVLLNPEWTWPPGTDARGLFQLEDAGIWNVTETTIAAGPSTHKTVPLEKMTLSIMEN